MLKLGVPVATPLKFEEIFFSFFALLKPKSTVNGFKKELEKFIGSKKIILVGSGREALYIAFEILKKSSNKKEVIIPAFICPSVPFAIRKANLIPVLCDIKIPGYGMNEDDLDKLIDERCLSVIPTHLFGYSQNLEKIKNLCSKFGSYIIEDCAQSFGRDTGKTGNLSIYSFGMAKVLSTYWGGALAVNDENLLNDFCNFSEPYSNSILQFIILSKIFILNLIIRFKFLGPLDYIWKKKFQRSNEFKDFQIKPFYPANCKLGSFLLNRFFEITGRRKEKAIYYYENLKNLKGVVLPTFQENDSFLRFPILVEDINKKKKLLKSLKRIGINASEMYDKENFEKVLSISKAKGKLLNAEYASERMINLPTHSFLRNKELEKIVDIFYENFK